MVTMRLATLLPLAALGVGYTPMDVEASGLQYNPVTYVQGPLSAQHPAYGAPLQGDWVRPVIFADPNEARAQTMQIINASAIAAQTQRQKRRHLEADSADVGKLEEYFGGPVERNYQMLMKEAYKSGAAEEVPWPGSYWPMYLDSINAQISGGKSPAERYADANGYNVQEFMDNISRQMGIDGYSSYPTCTGSSSTCPVCAIREGRTQGYCLETWWGICHAWASAAVLEPEPRCDVVKNGVTFRPVDIKGLLSAVYDGAGLSTVFLGARFDGPDFPVNTDVYGRYTDAAQRDLGSGLFHIAVANIMGKFNKSFVVDVASDSEVWNQPVRDYTIISSEVLDLEVASVEFFGTTEYPFNGNAKYLAPTTMRFRWIEEAYVDGPLIPDYADAYTQSRDYEYLLELDAEYNIIGGEWLGASRADHPDFLWFPTERPSLDVVTSVNLKYKDIRELLDLSVACSATA